MNSITSAAHQKLLEKKSAKHDVQSRTSMNKNYEQEGFMNIKQHNNKGKHKVCDLNLPYREYALVSIIFTIIELYVELYV